MSKFARPMKIQIHSQAEDRRITAAARRDPDAQPLTRQQLAQLAPAKGLRGRPPVPNKKLLVSVRYSPEVLAYFRATGDGWQARMDGVLKRYVATQERRKALR
jgi:uncharacterized protein (DUF4415 family)